MRALENTTTVYKFYELDWDLQLKLVAEKYPKLKEKGFIEPLYYEKTKNYYENVEFYADGTIYEEI